MILLQNVPGTDAPGSHPQSGKQESIENTNTEKLGLFRFKLYIHNA